MDQTCRSMVRPRVRGFLSAIRRDQILERHRATVLECHRLVRVRNRRRNVGIIERIVERITEEDERATTMMAPHDTDRAKSTISISVRAGAVVWIIRRP